jgi:2-oxoglutarate ferredoxin oxidoreductase subunit alpha
MSSLSSDPAASAATTAAPAHADAVVLAIVGSGGDGVALLGDILMQMAADQGIYGMMVQSYGPQIRGGESAIVLRLSRSEVQYEGDAADLLLCFRTADLRRFQGMTSLHDRSAVILEASDQGELPEWLGRAAAEPYRHPFTRVENGVEVSGEPKNMKALALITRMLGWDPDFARSTLRKRFGHRPKILEMDLGAFESSIGTTELPPFPKLRGDGRKLHVETGNEAIARGAMDAGLGFFAGYPITPSSEVMETVIDELPSLGGRVVQAEDEIAALGMVIGASFGGALSMTATSGPGLSLMTEMLGLASMAEIPTVVVDCQRAGPATGMPSRTEQSDLFHAVYGGHGDFPRVVLGVFDVVHAREVMKKAFHLSETWQLPVIVLSDAYIAQRRQIRDVPHRTAERAYRRRWVEGDGPARFDLAGDHGVNPFRLPGTPGGTYLTSGIEHTPEGTPTADTGMHQRMNEKRFRKIPAIAEASGSWYRLLGRPEAPCGIVAWGSQYGLLREWVVSHGEFRVFMPEILHPFPLEAFEKWRQGLSTCAVVELSYQGQFHRYLSGITDMRGVRSLARSGGVPLNARELRGLLEGRSC